MSSVAVTRDLDVPPARVFAFLADGRRHAEWRDGDDNNPLAESMGTEHIDGPEVGQGARYRLRTRIRDQDRTDDAFTTEVYEPQRRLVFRADSGYELAFDLEETATGTRVTFTRDFGAGPPGFLSKLLLRRLTPKYGEPQLAGDMTRIEKALGA